MTPSPTLTSLGQAADQAIAKVSADNTALQNLQTQLSNATAQTASDTVSAQQAAQALLTAAQAALAALEPPSTSSSSSSSSGS